MYRVYRMNCGVRIEVGTYASEKRARYIMRVKAESEDEAYELAEEKYCTGDYEEHPENSETWSAENVTKEYNV